MNVTFLYSNSFLNDSQFYYYFDDNDSSININLN
jgi:hypothetical protein